MKKFGRACAKIGFKSGNLLAVSLLSLLLKKPSYGYSLLDELKKFGINNLVISYGVIYRILRNMEIDGLVSSKWEIQESGPSKRIYFITDKGKKFLKEWLFYAKENLKVVEKIIETIEKLLKG